MGDIPVQDELNAIREMPFDFEDKDNILICLKADISTLNQLKDYENYILLQDIPSNLPDFTV